jgi:hypothetical protein
MEENELFDFIPELWSVMLEFGIRNLVEESDLLKKLLKTMAKYKIEDQVSMSTFFFLLLKLILSGTNKSCLTTSAI